MFEYFQILAKNKGYKTIRVYTDNSFSAAIKLYEKKGMNKEYYKNKDESNEVTLNTIIYSKSLENTEVEMWNDKFLGLTNQSKKEKG